MPKNLTRFSVLTPVVTILLAGCGGGAAERLSTNAGNTSRASGGRIVSACTTLSSYAFDGIPARYVDDGANLLYVLAGEFSLAGRGEIATAIERIVDLTYQGSYGQLTAKSELTNLAKTYC